MPTKRGKRVQRPAPAVPALELGDLIPKIPAGRPMRRGAGRPPSKRDLSALGSGQRMFLLGVGFDLKHPSFIGRQRFRVALACDAWWDPLSERLLFINTRPKDELRFLWCAGIEDRAEHEMRISALSLYRLEGPLELPEEAT